MVVSLLSSPEHNQRIDALAERFAGVPIVIDHLGHPAIGAKRSDSQMRQLLGLSRHPHVLMKLSGFYHFSHEQFPYRDCWDMARAVSDTFGPERLLWGSDFPHVVPSCGYAPSLALLDEVFPQWGDRQRAAVLGGNALRLYCPCDGSNASIDRP